VLLQDMYNLFRVGIYFTHRSMLFVLTLITKIFRPSSEIASFTISFQSSYDNIMIDVPCHYICFICSCGRIRTATHLEAGVLLPFA
jgi:hypothetical protein